MRRLIGAVAVLLLATTLTVIAGETNSPSTVPFTVEWLPSPTPKVGKKNLTTVSSLSIRKNGVRNDSVRVTIRGVPGKKYALKGDCQIPSERILETFVMPEGGQAEFAVGFPTANQGFFGLVHLD
ncbi:MAG: hypothetical protein AAB797_03740 [Patescibacteria group bacterium]